MKHLVDHPEPIPFGCEDCKNFIGLGKCKAFDLIPVEFFGIGEDHKKVLEGQKGDYVFEPKTERRYDNVFAFEEFGD